MQARVLARLRDEGPLSKAQLADLLKVSRTTIAAEAGRLAELGLAQEVGPAASRGGRRSTLIDLAPAIRFVGIAHRGHRHRRGGDGRPARRAGQTPGPATSGRVRRWSWAGARPGAQGARRGGGRTAVGAGVGVPGPVDFPAGVPVSPPIMPGWDGYPVRDALSRELGCPVRRRQRRQHAWPWASSTRAWPGHSRDFLFVKIGTGIGCGIVIDGELYRGVNGCAGDIGHIRVDDFGPMCACGNTGCLEAFCGGAALARDATTAARSGRSDGARPDARGDRRADGRGRRAAAAAGRPGGGRS